MDAKHFQDLKNIYENRLVGKAVKELFKDIDIEVGSRMVLMEPNGFHPDGFEFKVHSFDKQKNNIVYEVEGQFYDNNFEWCRLLEQQDCVHIWNALCSPCGAVIYGKECVKCGHTEDNI